MKNKYNIGIKNGVKKQRCSKIDRSNGAATPNYQQLQCYK